MSGASPGRRRCLPCAALVLTACAAGTGQAAREAVDAARHGAALAHVVVDNRTAATVAVAYRPGVGAGGEVGIGRAAPAARTELAPVPAGEPLRFVVRGLPRGSLELAPLSLAVDARRTLVVAADSAWWEG